MTDWDQFVGLQKASQCAESINGQRAVREISYSRFMFSAVIRDWMDLKILFYMDLVMYNPRFSGIYRTFTHLPENLNTNPYRIGCDLTQPIFERKVNRHRQLV